MTGWQIAFFTLQVVVGIIITAFISMLASLNKDFKHLDNKTNVELGRLREKTNLIDRKQNVSDAIAEERYKSLNNAINEGFKSVGKNIDNINKKIDKIMGT